MYLLVLLLSTISTVQCLPYKDGLWKASSLHSSGNSDRDRCELIDIWRCKNQSSNSERLDQPEDSSSSLASSQLSYAHYRLQRDNGNDMVKRFEVNCSLMGFDTNDVRISMVGSMLKISARNRLTISVDAPNGQQRIFDARYKLPVNANDEADFELDLVDDLRSTKADGILEFSFTVNGPKPSHADIEEESDGEQEVTSKGQAEIVENCHNSKANSYPALVPIHRIGSKKGMWRNTSDFIKSPSPDSLESEDSFAPHLSINSPESDSNSWFNNLS